MPWGIGKSATIETIQKNGARTSIMYSGAEFMKPYLVNGAGHFNPMGNHFIAYSIKDKVIELLDPKPVPYQQSNARIINFKGYLHGGVYQ
jgi:hypothetical protein